MRKTRNQQLPLARLRGLGSRAVIVPEMERFAAQYGFEFICHEKDHANRKAGNERSFYTTETNFIPGRTFKTFEDLNVDNFLLNAIIIYYSDAVQQDLLSLPVRIQAR